MNHWAAKTWLITGRNQTQDRCQQTWRNLCCVPQNIQMMIMEWEMHEAPGKQQTRSDSHDLLVSPINACSTACVSACLSVFLSVCMPACVPASVCLSVSICLSLYVCLYCVYMSVSVCMPVCVCMSAFVFVCVSLCFCMSVWVCMPVSDLYIFHYLSVSAPVCLH